MAWDGRAVANFILDYCGERQLPVTNLALQKLVFFAHVWCLVELNRPLVRHNFEAWQFGPVLQYLYREFKAFDRSAIATRATRVDPESGRREVVSYDFDSDTKALLESVVEFYARLSASALVELSHVRDGPWHQVWNHAGSVNPGMLIPAERIKDYYSKVVPPFQTRLHRTADG